MAALRASETGAGRLTIIIFARAPVPGKVKTRLIPAVGAKMASALAHAFNLDALRKVSALRQRLVVCGLGRKSYFERLASPYEALIVGQASGDLGRRMAKALEPWCREGAILLGTDTPSLPPDHLKRAIELLSIAPVVIGPSFDGGYYLIGVRGPLPDIFEKMEWGTETVLENTLSRLRSRSVPFELAPPWYDIDTKDDLERLVADLRRLASYSIKSGEILSLNQSAEISAFSPNPCPATTAVLQRMGLL